MLPARDFGRRVGIRPDTGVVTVRMLAKPPLTTRMRADKIGRLLLAVGLLVGIAGGVGLLTGFEPARLPAALLNIAAYKLTFLAAFGLIAAGAIFRRYARRDALTDVRPPAVKDGLELSSGQSAHMRSGKRQRERVHTPSDDEKTGL